MAARRDSGYALTLGYAPGDIIITMKITKQRLREIIREELAEVWNPFRKKEKAPAQKLTHHGEGWKWGPPNNASGRDVADIPPKNIADAQMLLRYTPARWRRNIKTLVEQTPGDANANLIFFLSRIALLPNHATWEDFTRSLNT